MTEDENAILDNLSNKNRQFFIPLAWAANLITQARVENRIRDDFAQKTLIDVSLCELAQSQNLLKIK